MFLAKAPSLTVLVPLKDEHGVLRFPHSGGPYSGIHAPMDSSKPLARQATDLARDFLKMPDAEFTPLAAIDPVLKSENQVSSVLYILKPNFDHPEVDKAWPTMAQILRSLSSGPNRLAYMKALQYLAGAADADVNVLEVDDEVRSKLKELDLDPLP